MPIEGIIRCGTIDVSVIPADLPSAKAFPMAQDASGADLFDAVNTSGPSLPSITAVCSLSQPTLRQSSPIVVGTMSGMLYVLLTTFSRRPGEVKETATSGSTNSTPTRQSSERLHETGSSIDPPGASTSIGYAEVFQSTNVAEAATMYYHRSYSDLQVAMSQRQNFPVWKMVFSTVHQSRSMLYVLCGTSLAVFDVDPIDNLLSSRFSRDGDGMLTPEGVIDFSLAERRTEVWSADHQTVIGTGTYTHTVCVLTATHLLFYDQHGNLGAESKVTVPSACLAGDLMFSRGGYNRAARCCCWVGPLVCVFGSETHSYQFYAMEEEEMVDELKLEAKKGPKTVLAATPLLDAFRYDDTKQEAVPMHLFATIDNVDDFFPYVVAIYAIVWGEIEPRQRFPLTSQFPPRCLTSDGPWLVVGTRDGGIDMYSWETGELMESILEMETIRGNSLECRSCFWSAPRSSIRYDRSVFEFAITATRRLVAIEITSLSVVLASMLQDTTVHGHGAEMLMRYGHSVGVRQLLPAQWGQTGGGAGVRHGVYVTPTRDEYDEFLDSFIHLDTPPEERQIRKDELSPQCRDCGKKFGVVNKARNCEVCGGRCCKDSCVQRKPVHHYGYQLAPMRVCAGCLSKCNRHLFTLARNYRYREVLAFLEDPAQATWCRGFNRVQIAHAILQRSLGQGKHALGAYLFLKSLKIGSTEWLHFFKSTSAIGWVAEFLPSILPHKTASNRGGFNARSQTGPAKVYNDPVMDVLRNEARTASSPTSPDQTQNPSLQRATSVPNIPLTTSQSTPEFTPFRSGGAFKRKNGSQTEVGSNNSSDSGSPGALTTSASASVPPISPKKEKPAKQPLISPRSLAKFAANRSMSTLGFFRQLVSSAERLGIESAEHQVEPWLYNTVLAKLMKKDPLLFERLLLRWPAGLFDPLPVAQGVEALLKARQSEAASIHDSCSPSRSTDEKKKPSDSKFKKAAGLVVNSMKFANAMKPSTPATPSSTTTTPLQDAEEGLAEILAAAEQHRQYSIGQLYLDDEVILLLRCLRRLYESMEKPTEVVRSFVEHGLTYCTTDAEANADVSGMRPRAHCIWPSRPYRSQERRRGENTTSFGVCYDDAFRAKLRWDVDLWGYMEDHQLLYLLLAPAQRPPDCPYKGPSLLPALVTQQTGGLADYLLRVATSKGSPGNTGAPDESQQLTTATGAPVLDSLINQLNDRPRMQTELLHSLSSIDPTATAAFHALQAELYVRYKPSYLLDFLRNPNVSNLNWKKLVDHTKRNRMYPELAYLIGRMGNHHEAVRVAVRCSKDVEFAVRYAKDVGDPTLWDEINKHAIQSPMTIASCLRHYPGTCDVYRLLKAIPEKNRMVVPNGGVLMKEVVQERRMAAIVGEASRELFQTNAFEQMKQLRRANNAAVRFAPKREDCVFCKLPLEEARDCVVSGCGHMSHSTCATQFLSTELTVRKPPQRMFDSVAKAEAKKSDPGYAWSTYRFQKRMGDKDPAELLPKAIFLHIIHFVPLKQRRKMYLAGPLWARRVEEAAIGVGRTFELDSKAKFAAIHKLGFIGELIPPQRRPVRRLYVAKYKRDHIEAPDFSTLLYTVPERNAPTSPVDGSGVPGEMQPALKFVSKEGTGCFATPVSNGCPMCDQRL